MSAAVLATTGNHTPGQAHILLIKSGNGNQKKGVEGYAFLKTLKQK